MLISYTFHKLETWLEAEQTDSLEGAEGGYQRLETTAFKAGRLK